VWPVTSFASTTLSVEQTVFIAAGHADYFVVDENAATNDEQFERVSDDVAMLACSENFCASGEIHDARRTPGKPHDHHTRSGPFC
jgi:hypothetical protein